MNHFLFKVARAFSLDAFSVLFLPQFLKISHFQKPSHFENAPIFNKSLNLKNVPFSKILIFLNQSRKLINSLNRLSTLSIFFIKIRAEIMNFHENFYFCSNFSSKFEQKNLSSSYSRFYICVLSSCCCLAI